MMFQICSFLAVLLFVNTSFSQIDTSQIDSKKDSSNQSIKKSTRIFSGFLKFKNNYISLNPLGIAFPQGDFKANEYFDCYCGSAKTGWSANLESFWFPLAYLGFGGQIGWMLNDLDDSKYKEVVSAWTGSNKFETTNGKYFSLSLLLGPIFSLGNERMAFDIKVLGGYLVVSDPSNEFKNYYDTYYFESKSQSAISGTWAFNAGFGYRYYLTKSFGLKINLDYVGSYFSNFTKTYSTNVIYSTGKVYHQSDDIYQYSTRVSSLNINVGVFFNLN